MKVFIICPVRNVTEQIKLEIELYIASLKSKGIDVYYPLQDTDQTDPIGNRICSDNREAIFSADEVHIYWTGSEGSLFDLGMAWAYHKPLKLINRVAPAERKSFENLLLEESVFDEYRTD